MAGRSWRERWRLGESEGLEEVIPGRENQIAGNGSHPAKKLGSGADLGSGDVPEVFGVIANGVKCKGEQVEGNQDCCKILLSMAKVVL